MLTSLSRIRKAIVAGVGTGGSVYASLAALATVAWWVPLTIAGVAGLGVGVVTYWVPNSSAASVGS